METNYTEFYRQKFVTPHPWRWYHTFFLPIHVGLYKTYWIAKHIPVGWRVLDIGCGGGREYFAKKYEMYGVDISPVAVENAKRFYREVKLADVNQIPYEDNSFDCVMSMDLLGHIPINQKEQILSEIHRVLKPGGFSVHYIETDRIDNKLQLKFPELYSENFIIKDGHFGLETPSQTLLRFSRKFNILEYAGHAALLSPIEDYAKRFDNPMRHVNPWINFLTGVSKLVGNHTYIRFVINCLLGWPARILNRLVYLDHSSGIFIAAQKPKNWPSVRAC